MTGQFVAGRSIHVAVDGKPLSSAQLNLQQNISPCPNPAKAAATFRKRALKTPKLPTQKKKTIFLQQYRHDKAKSYCTSS